MLLGAGPQSSQDGRNHAGVDGDERKQIHDEHDEQQQKHECAPARTASPALVRLHQRYGGLALCRGQGVPGIQRSVPLDPTLMSRELKQLPGSHERGTSRDEARTYLRGGLR
jgi:hypothetical protein